MKIVHSDFRKGIVKVYVGSIDDLWYLSSIIEINDYIKGQTFRKIKIGKEGDRKQSIIKKKIFLKIKVDNVDFHKYSNILRVSGTIVEGPEDVSHGSHHTFNVEENTTLSIIKDSWPGFQIKRLKEASQQRIAKIMMCVMDREDAYFALIKKFGYEVLSNLKGDVVKKALEREKGKDFYGEIRKMLEQYDKKYRLDSIILASPAFWKDDFMKSLKNDELRKKIVLAACSSSDEGAFNEVLKRQEVQEVLKQDRISKEIKFVDELLAEISKEGNAAYGFKEVEQAANAGAVKILLVSDNYILEMRQIKKYKEVDSVMKVVESTKGEIHIVSSEHDGGKKLDGLGGIGAVLRYKVEF